MNYSISSDSNDDIFTSTMNYDQYNDMMDNIQTLDEYNQISNRLYEKIYEKMTTCPDSLFKKLNINSKYDFWKFILENCIGIKYIDHINNIYQFKEKFNN